MKTVVSKQFKETKKPATARASLLHLKALDLSSVLAGPWASQLLADMGAKVIKI